MRRPVGERVGVTVKLSPSRLASHLLERGRHKIVKDVARKQIGNATLLLSEFNYDFQCLGGSRMRAFRKR